MRNVLIDPFVVCFPILGATIIRNTDQVADILSNHWHGAKGPLYMLAVQISMEHMLSKRRPHEVRQAMLAAAEEAGFPISYEILNAPGSDDPHTRPSP
ncbi:DUF982 domain-containing protein [Mesorhizobium sp. UC22_110]|uniref:DUF982 domain-containing protein n=1 Tax=unclassified Mesorhizobium TaxID=325217 RepID=UPI00366EA434